MVWNCSVLDLASFSSFINKPNGSIACFVLPMNFPEMNRNKNFHFESECNFAILCILHFIFLSLDQIASFSFFVMLNEKSLNFVTGKVTVPVLISDNQLVFSFG